MKYRSRIDPELRTIARKIPYNKFLIKCANIFQAVSFRFTKLPQGVVNRRMIVEGYKGLKFRTEIFEPSSQILTAKSSASLACGGIQPVGGKDRGKLPCLIYVHGGAFSYRASAYHKKLACIYAAKAKCRVYFPDYHLMPAYPYPAAYADVAALYRYILDHADEAGIDVEKIGVAGDSAGACIAALLCNRYEQEALKRPCVQMLVYPLTDADMRTESMKRFSDTPLWNSKNNRRMWRYYCGNLNAEERYGASPMHGSLPGNIPDTYIETAEYDCLHDEGILYGKKLRAAGVNVVINDTEGTFHGYDVALNTGIAVRNIKRRISFLRKEFGK